MFVDWCSLLPATCFVVQNRTVKGKICQFSDCSEFSEKREKGRREGGREKGKGRKKETRFKDLIGGKSICDQDCLTLYLFVTTLKQT